MKTTLLFLIISSLIIFSTQSRSIIPRPQPLSSLEINTSQDEGNCSYAVNIRTSCFSPPFTRDSISLRFGDANGNEICAPNLDGRFGRCSLDSFVINGPCVNPTICYVSLYRSGKDGWIPLDVIIIPRHGSRVNFFFNVSIPNNAWYEISSCFGAQAASLAVK